MSGSETNRRRRVSDFPLSREEAFNLISTLERLTTEMHQVKEAGEKERLALETMSVRMKNICDQVQEIKSVVKQDHDLITERTATIESIPELKNTVDSINTIQNRWKGGAGLIVIIIMVLGALGAWVVKGDGP